MAKNIVKNKRLFTFILSLLLFFSSSVSLGNSPLVNAEDTVIDEEIFDSFLTDEYVGVIVYLKEQLDFKEVEQSPDNKYEVVGSLKEIAETTQEDILTYIERQKEKGNVIEYHPYYIINAIYVNATEEVITKLSKMKEVDRIFENSLLERDTLQPISENRSVMLRSARYIVEDNVEWNIKQIGADKVWDEFGVDGNGVVVGIIDSGVDWEHEALKEKWRGYNPNDPFNPNPIGNWFDAVSGKEMPYDEPGDYHGSHVTGTILGQDKNGENKIGVAPGAKWIAAKAFNKQGGYPSWILAAGEWMLAPNGDPSLAPDIINNSWTTNTKNKDGIDEWYRPMVQAWKAAGIMPIFATGNDTSRNGAKVGSVGIPANYPESFSVGAVDKNNALCKFSKRGPSTYEGEYIKPEIVAPGEDIRSSIIGGYAGGWQGTSMATPHVTGTAALILSANRNLSIEDIENILIDTATPLTDTNYKESPNQGYGYGLVNAYEAVKSIYDKKSTATVKGKVLGQAIRSGNKNIIHEPLEYIFGDIAPMEARVKNDITIKEVQLLIKSNDQWIPIPMTMESGSLTDGIYKVNVPNEYLRDSNFTYKIKAVDYKNNVLETKEYNVEKSFGILPDKYETDFSKYPVGWTFDGDWQWGRPNSLPYIYSDRNMIGTNLSGKYSRDTTSTLEMPPIDLRESNYENVVLKISHYREFDLLNDVARILISNDNKQTWQELSSFAGQRNYYWQEMNFLEDMCIDLTNYIGCKNPVYIKFQLTSTDHDGNYGEGWYLDNVKLVGTDNEPPNPPKSLKANTYPTGVVLNWTAPWSDDVASYRIYRSLGVDKDYELVGESFSRNFIDMSVEEDNTYYYKVTAVDIFGNESIPSIREASVTIEFLQNNIYFSDFEEDNGGFTSDGENNHWEWGEPKRSAPAEAFTGTKAWATNLLGKYYPNSNAWIETPEIQLPKDTTSYLNFHHWLNIWIEEESKIYISEKTEEGWSDWNPLGSTFSTTFNEKNWKEENISLQDYEGMTIKLRFILHSEEKETSVSGWYIDDVLIYSEKVVEVENESVELDNKDLELDEKIDLNEEEIESNTEETEVNNSDEELEINDEKTEVENLEEINKEETEISSEEMELEDEEVGIDNESLELDIEDSTEGLPKKTLFKSMVLLEDSKVFDNYKEFKEVEKKEKQQLDETIEEKNIVPVDAKITILETGNSTRTNLKDGSYEISTLIDKNGETLTLKVEAYGYSPQEVKVNFDPNKIVEKDFILEESAATCIKGRVINSVNKQPIKDAYITIKENRGFNPISTDENGNFEIENIIQGRYTLVIEKMGYKRKEITLNVEDNMTAIEDICLSKSNQFSWEIGYDDGSHERAVVGNSSDKRPAGAAIRITPSEYGKILGTNIYFTDKAFPIPGGNKIGVAIYTADDKGKPASMYEAPIFFEIKRGEWNYLDLSSLDFYTDKDFFIATVQDNIKDFMPAIGVDDDTILDNRSFMHMNEVFLDISHSMGTGKAGTLMIRGVMGYDMGVPQIISDKSTIYTREEIFSLNISTNMESHIKLYKKDQLIKEEPSINGDFSVDVNLEEGINEFKLTTSKNGKEIETDSITLIKDTISPIITITNPVDKSIYNNNKVLVKGSIEDEWLEEVTVNGKIVKLDNENNFIEELLLEEGKHNIEIIAKDKAGNISIESIEITVKLPIKEEEDDNRRDEESTISKKEDNVIENNKDTFMEVTLSNTSASIKDKEGKVELNIEKGTFDKLTKVRLDIVDEKTISKAEESDLNRISEVIEISLVPTNKLNKPMLANFKLKQSSIEGKNKELLGVYRLDEKTDSWKYIGGKVDDKNNTITVKLNKSGKYTVMESTKTFKDIEKHWGKYEIQIMAAKQIIEGTDGINYKPNKEVTKAEFIKMLVSTLGVEEINPSEQWYIGYMNAALETGLINEKVKDPNSIITREEMGVIIAKGLEYLDKEKTISKEIPFKDLTNLSKDSIEYISVIYKNGIIEGRTEDTFVPEASATKAEAATVIYRLLKVLEEI
ncbi:S8 family serine peptidase [Tissierella sp. MSJ-40]|uniref:S8 family serine peptidase n=1 Tax=Tissierella simiarum TaxID=2841534 RepID=A0ABS6E2F8_9FIRM|nr:S8 family serine peptidase [Tissierella simiarum]MBU5436977.1 S8 family serine peptidase [Tissierella simiarum]